MRLLLCLLLLDFLSVKADVAIDSEMAGPKSKYTAFIQKEAAKEVAGKGEKPNWPDPIQIECIDTPGQRFLIGAIQKMGIAAPLEKVASLMDKVEGLTEIFPGFAKIEVESRASNSYSVHWEKKIPIFFISNIHYRTQYLVDKKPNKVIYRYKLKEATPEMRTADGLIVLYRQESSTKFLEYDFWDSDYGVVERIFPGRIWSDSIEGLFLADAAVKLRSEQPTATPKDIQRQAKELLSQFDAEKCITNKRALNE